MNTVAAVVVFLGVLSLAAGQSCPRIVTRAEWGARAASTSVLPTFPPTHVVIHHTVTGACTTIAACSQIMRSMQNHHIDGNGWADIGYNFVVGGDGNVYTGRGWNRQGAHTVNFNSRSIGIAFIGTFTSGNPTAAAQNAAQQLIACGVAQGQIARNYRLMGHRQGAATACPGNTLFATIQRWPNWTSNP
ncbi:peptidoglycan-recognition protein SC2-like [Onthophagus taurus]|uniref:peptidoglycan-recognition protein SC2-like n=1 Tax=Onthophagus taurus TaxID=166361 RepID=UPI000C2070D3|nr:peptidoglycan-recognition protein SC2-like [Onthophagus taurus]